MRAAMIRSRAPDGRTHPVSLSAYETCWDGPRTKLTADTLPRQLYAASMLRHNAAMACRACAHRHTERGLSVV